MKHFDIYQKSSAGLFTGLFVTLFFCLVYASPCQADNLIINGGFESWQGDLPDGWSTDMPVKNVVKCTDAFGGAQCCQIIRTAKGAKSFSSNWFSLEMGHYDIRFQAKGVGKVRLAAKYNTRPSYSDTLDIDTEEWTCIQHTVEIKKDQDSVQLVLSICLTDSDGLYLDNVEFCRVATALEAPVQNSFCRAVNGGIEVDADACRALSQSSFEKAPCLYVYDLLGNLKVKQELTAADGLLFIPLEKGIYLTSLDKFLKCKLLVY